MGDVLVLKIAIHALIPALVKPTYASRQNKAITYGLLIVNAFFWTLWSCQVHKCSARSVFKTVGP